MRSGVCCCNTDDRDEALRWKVEGRGDYTMGEVSNLMTYEETGFDFDNSPRNFYLNDVRGKTLIQIDACNFTTLVQREDDILVSQPVAWLRRPGRENEALRTEAKSSPKGFVLLARERQLCTWFPQHHQHRRDQRQRCAEEERR